MMLRFQIPPHALRLTPYGLRFGICPMLFGESRTRITDTDTV
jgi:hypothetical protein